MEATKAVITGYFNNDFYTECLYSPDVSPDKVKDIIKEKLPIGK